MASINLPINIKKLLADQQAAIIANTDAKTVETKAHITTKATATNTEIANKAIDTQNAVVADGDATQAQLTALTVVNGDINTEVQAINNHVTAENDRVLANIPSNSPINSIQRGVHQLTDNWDEVTINAVDMSKTQLNVYGVGASDSSASNYLSTELMPMVYLKDATTIYASRFSNIATSKYTWEVIEYV